MSTRAPNAGTAHADRSAGLTLVEVLVSLTILAFVALGVTSLLGVAIKQNKLAAERSIATGLAAGRLDQLSSMRYRTAADYSGYKLPEETVRPGPPPALEADFGAIPGYPAYSRRVTLAYDSPVVGMLTVRVEVSWWNHAQNQRKQHTMITYLHPGLGATS